MMASTSRTTTYARHSEPAVSLLWHTWPIVDERRWSWMMLALIFAVAVFIWYIGGGWLLSMLAALGLGITLWEFFLPVEYEIASHGIRRRVLGRTRLIPWHAIRAYQIRPTGVVLFQRSDPRHLDLLRSLFIPNPPVAGDLIEALRQQASHATEMTE